MIVPDSPTAQPVVALTKVVASKRLSCGNGFCHTHVPSPVETPAPAAGTTIANNERQTASTAPRMKRRPIRIPPCFSLVGGREITTAVPETDYIQAAPDLRGN